MNEQTEAGFTGSDAPPPPPPSQEPPKPGAEKRPRTGRFDLGYLFGFPFRDPNAIPKFLIGCVMVLLILALGFGLVPLAGYLLRTARRELRGEELPLPDWSDFGGILVDGFRVIGVVLVYGMGVLVTGLAWVAFITVVGFLGGSPESVGVVFGILGVIAMLALGLLGAAVFVPTGILRLAATDRFADAFLIRDNLELVRQNSGTYLFLLVTLVLFDLLADASILICLVGAIPGTFWGMAASGAAIGHAGAVMGVKAE